MKTALVIILGIGFIVGMFYVAKRNTTGKTGWDDVPKDQRTKVIKKGIVGALVATLLIAAVSAIGIYLNPMSWDSLWHNGSELSDEEDEVDNSPVRTFDGYILDDTILVPTPDGYEETDEYDSPYLEFRKATKKRLNKFEVAVYDGLGFAGMTDKIDEDVSNGTYDGEVKTDLGTFYYSLFDEDEPDFYGESIARYTNEARLDLDDKTIYVTITSPKLTKYDNEMFVDYLKSVAKPEKATEKKIDYMVLVNRDHILPDDWEEDLDTVSLPNSVGDEVVAERRAYEAYEQLRQDMEKEGVHLQLDSAYRSVKEQQEIVDDFTGKYGKEYVSKYVAVPGYSEHHTGLALDLYFQVDGKDIYENEDLVKYPEIWEKIHARLADYGFILRYPEGKDSITGCAYEPWHIRYLDSPEKAKEITEKGITLEEYLK